MSSKRTRTELITAPDAEPPAQPTTHPAPTADGPAVEPPAKVEITAIAMIVNNEDYWECARCTWNPRVARIANGRKRGIPSQLSCGHELVSGGHAAISAQLPLTQPHANMVIEAAKIIQCSKDISLIDGVEKAFRHLAAALCVANPSAVVAASYYADKPVPVTTFSMETGNFEAADEDALQAWRDNILIHVQTKWWYMQNSFPTTCTHGSDYSHTDLDLVVHWMMHVKMGPLYYCEFCAPRLTIAARVVTHDPVAPTASQLAAIFATPA